MSEKRTIHFISPQALIFAVLFSVQFLVRTILDWFMPTLDLRTRATVSTVLGIATLLAAGVSASWRSNSMTAGAVSGVVTASLAAIISITGAAMILIMWHDPQTMAAIDGSGGLEEVFSFPIMMILPGMVLGFVGGIACIAIKKALST